MKHVSRFTLSTIVLMFSCALPFHDLCALRGKRPDSNDSEGGELLRQLRQDLLDQCQEEQELDSLLEIAKQSVRNVTADFVTHK